MRCSWRPRQAASLTSIRRTARTGDTRGASEAGDRIVNVAIAIHTIGFCVETTLYVRDGGGGVCFRTEARIRLRATRPNQRECLRSVVSLISLNSARPNACNSRGTKFRLRPCSWLTIPKPLTGRRNYAASACRPCREASAKRRSSFVKYALISSLRSGLLNR
jgi:hypothetical protein